MSSDENGKIDQINLPRKRNDIFDNEAIRIIKSIPEWNIMYQRGKRHQQIWAISIIFRPQEEI